ESPIGLRIWTPPTGDVIYIYNDQVAQTQQPIRQPIRQAARERIQNRMENRPPPPDSRTAEASANHRPPPPPKREPSDPNDWSPFTKVMPDDQNFITVKFMMPRPGPISVQLVDRAYAIKARFNIPSEKQGERVKKFPLENIGKGEYLLIIRSGKEVLRKYQVVKR
ncbi:MAG: hypothetical protein KI786_02280, partial [Mameliella sp.]|nr:hypothetical protein [Phaeodactylibacter sp.]